MIAASGRVAEVSAGSKKCMEAKHQIVELKLFYVILRKTGKLPGA